MGMLIDPAVADLALASRTRFGLDILVETGTFDGVSTEWAASRFSQVYTIEINQDYQRLARERCAGHDNVTFLLGDTRVCLQFVVSILAGPSLFWLDAHAAPGLFGLADDWPVMEELSVIGRSPHHHVILIDDAHCFLPSSPYPACPPLFLVAGWARASGYDCVVVADVIALTPVC